MITARLKPIVYLLLATGLAAGAVAAGAQPWGFAPDAQLPPSAFPTYASAYPRGGIFLTPAEIAEIMPGLTKDQLRQRLGSPHFSEGISDVTEWGYVVTVRRAGIRAICQLRVNFYKTRFNDPYQISHLSWDKPDCVADRPVSPQVEALPEPVPAPMPMPMPMQMPMPEAAATEPPAAADEVTPTMPGGPTLTPLD